jgi:DNA-directed RNA polymerase subunit M/transcription elongation factor TFIIS
MPDGGAANAPDTADGDKCKRCGGKIEHRDGTGRCDKCDAYVAVAIEVVNEEIRKPNVDKVVDVYCECQSENEVDIQGLERGESDIECGRCGSTEIVFEVLAE